MHRLAQFLGLVALAFACHAAAAADLYVSPDGNDNWTGNLETPNPARTDGPLATLSGARDASRCGGAAMQPPRAAAAAIPDVAIDRRRRSEVRAIGPA